MGKKIRNSIIISIGFLLSPLTPWNDFFINIPIAYIFAFLLGLISENFFNPALIIGYWLTNIIGFLMMQYGISRFNKNTKKYTGKQFAIDILISTLITMAMIILIKIGVIKFPTEYFIKV